MRIWIRYIIIIIALLLGGCVLLARESRVVSKGFENWMNWMKMGFFQSEPVCQPCRRGNYPPATD